MSNLAPLCREGIVQMTHGQQKVVGHTRGVRTWRGAGRRVRADRSGGAYVYSNPAWSPDSQQLAYTRCEIYDKEKGRNTPSMRPVQHDGGDARNTAAAPIGRY